MTTLREAAQQALEVLESGLLVSHHAQVLIDLRAALAQQAEPVQEPTEPVEPVAQYSDIVSDGGMDPRNKYDTAPPQRPAEPEGGGNLPPPLQVPAEVAATITTTDIAWLETRRLTKLWQELGQMRWAGSDEGWDRAIEAVRSRLNDECQAVLDWKSKADQSNATAIELLQKMQGLKDESPT